MRKRIVSIVTAITYFSFQVLSIETVLGNEQNTLSLTQMYEMTTEKGVEIFSNFSYKNVSGYTKKVFDEELKHNTGKIDANLENSLNKMGIQDEEIENWTNEEIERLEDATSISISIGYGEEKAETGETEIIEAEDFYKAYYDKKHGELTKENKKNTFKNILEGIGILPITVEAVQDENPNTDEQSVTGKFKHTLKLYTTTQKHNGKQTVYFEYEAMWLCIPLHNKEDYMTLEFSNGYVYEHDCRFNYTAEYTPAYPINSEPTATMTVSTSEHVIDYDLKAGDKSFLAYLVDLPGESEGYEEHDSLDGMYQYSDLKMKIYGYVFLWDSTIPQIAGTAYYEHFNSKKNLKITGISVSSAGKVSLGLTVTEMEYYDRIAKNLNAWVPVKVK